MTDRQPSLSSLRPPHPVSRKWTLGSQDSTNYFQFANIDTSYASIDPSASNDPYNSNDPYPSMSAQVYPSASDQSQYSGLDEEVGSYSDPDARFKRASHMFFAVSVVSAILTLILECFMYATINIHKQNLGSHQRYAEISIYLSLFIFAAVYQIVLTLIGLRTKNMLLLMMLCGFYACMLVYTGIQFNEIKNYILVSLPPTWRAATKGTNIAVIGVIAVTLVVQAAMIFLVLRRNVKWFRYKKIGGDFTIKTLYTVFQVHRSLLIFDFFFFLGFTVQFIVIMIDKKSSVEFILTVCVLPLTLVILVASDYAATRELVVLTVATVVCFLLGCAYVLFKTIRLFTKYTSAYNMGFEPGSYFPGRKSLVTFAAITLVLLVATVVIEVWMAFHYHRGLLPMVNTYYKWLPLHGEGHDHSISMDPLDPIDSEKARPALAHGLID